MSADIRGPHILHPLQWIRHSGKCPRHKLRAVATHWQSSESGKGYTSLFVTLIVLAAAAFVAYQTVPVYVHNYELNDYATGLAQQVAVNHVAPGDVPARIAARAEDLNLPVTTDNVKVEPGGSVVKINVTYTALIDLRVYIWPLHFSISVSAPRIALG